MKTIGRTNGNDYLMEVTVDEYWALDALAKTIEGKSLEYVDTWKRDQSVNGDFSGVFGAILAFAHAKFRINQIRQMADEFDATLMQRDEKSGIEPDGY